ncbi:MAG: FkbM family methyltransferase [Pseudomonadota bacterium]
MIQALRKTKWSLRRGLLNTGWVKLKHRTLADKIFVPYLHQALTKYDVDCVIDVGANHGQFATMLRTQIDFRGHVISFEAGLATYDRLATHISDIFDVEIHHCAIGSENGEMDLNVMELDVLNSFHTPPSTDISISANRVVNTETVPVRRLDTIAKENLTLRGAKRIFLKTDTQGFDLKVIAGAGGYWIAWLACSLRSRSHGFTKRLQPITKSSKRFCSKEIASRCVGSQRGRKG